MSNMHIYIQYIFNQADNAIIEMKNSEHFKWKLDGTCYIAIVTYNPVTFFLMFMGLLYNYMDNHIFFVK